MSETGAPLSDDAARRRGYLVTILGVLWISPDALVLRLIDSPALSVIGWRGGLSAVTLLLFLLWRDGGRILSKMWPQGWRLLTIAFSYTANSAAFVLAIELSSVADVLVIIAATPLCAALLGWVLLREAPSLRTAIAIALGFLGVLIAAAGGVGSGNLTGILIAVLLVFSLSAQFTLLRKWRQVDNVAAVFIGSIAMAIVSFIWGDPASITGDSRLWAMLLGFFLTPISFTLITVGPRYISSAEVSLLMLLETALGPIWVWLALGEVPAQTALIGGAVIVLSVVVATSGALRRKRRRQV